jgi:hypothetical protein
MPEDIEQLIVGDLCGIVRYFDRFAMLGFVGRDGPVICIFFASASVTDDGFGNAFDVVEWFLHAPETAPREKSGLGFGLNHDRAEKGGYENEKFGHDSS